MTGQATGKPIVAILWFVAASLAFLAVGVGFAADRHPNWAVAAGGLFCLIMGIAAHRRNRQSLP